MFANKTEEELAIIGLASAIVHILEGLRDGGRGLDFVSAQANLESEPVKNQLAKLDPVLLPLPRDGEDKQFTFPD